MLELSFFILLLLGIAAGVLAGLFGIGGGILFTPILFLLFNDAGISDPVLWTIGTSLFCTLIASSGSSIRQYRQDNFYMKEGTAVGLLGAAGVTFGKWVVTSGYYTEKVFVLFFSLLFLYVAFMFFNRGRTPDAEIDVDREPVRFRASAVAGGAGGFVAALAGIGGGAVMVPILNLYYRQPIRKTVSISSLAIVFISLSGVVQLAFVETAGASMSGYALGVVDLGTALPLAAGGLAGGFAGALINLKIDRRYLQYGFALLALAMTIKLISEIY